jgi:hypothetical protein
MKRSTVNYLAEFIGGKIVVSAFEDYLLRIGAVKKVSKKLRAEIQEILTYNAESLDEQAQDYPE